MNVQTDKQQMDNADVAAAEDMRQRSMSTTGENMQREAEADAFYAAQENAQITIGQQITVNGFEGADRTGTVISMNGGMSFLGQFVTIRLDVPFMQKNALNISKTISLRVVADGGNWKQPAFGKTN